MVCRNWNHQKNEMKEIIEWLINLEGISAKLYSESSKSFQNDPEMGPFLTALEHDEKAHGHIITDTIGRMQLMTDLPRPVIQLDDALKSRIERPIIDNQNLLERGMLTKERLFETIVSTEFSEWNDIFIYAVESLKGNGTDYKKAAPLIERHKKRILNFFSDMEGGSVYLDAIHNLKSLWKWRILVVDDDESVRNFLMALCRFEGEVDAARDGSEALAKIDEYYYDLVISDLSMPKLNGIELYEKAVQKYKQIGERFLYFSGLTGQYDNYIKQYSLKFLQKPAPIGSIQKAIGEILLR